jgi:hypothetical protein
MRNSIRHENSQNALLALAILVPEADSVIGEWRRQYDWSAVRGLGSHITILFPIDSSVCVGQRCRALESVFSEHASFNFVLREPRRYGNYVYFAPEQINPFVKLTETAMAVLPETVPYRVMSDCVTPHLTVAHSQDENILQHICAGLTAVSIESTALNIELMEYRDNAWNSHMRFPLGVF